MQSAGNPRLTIYYTDGTSTPVKSQIISKTMLTEYNYTSNSSKTISHLIVYYGDLGNIYIKKNSVQVEKGSKATPYEQYHAPVTSTIYLDSPLMENDYIDYELGQVVRSDGTIETVDVPKITTFNGTNILTVGTTSIPSSIEVSYTS